MTDLSPSAANGADRSPTGDPPIADITARPAAAGPEPTNDRALSEAVAAAVKEAKVMFDARAKTLTEQAQDSFAKLRTEAEKRRLQGIEMVRGRPYAAVAAAALAGFLIGHLTSGARTRVIVLRDDR